ncbi:hypothetical protein PVK06_005167 [Gossypium arboreum]|uniref:Uncharacterized protein n=1 Tax=Gossypium arboreum TaxID=29729 RepID=A0ABR0QTX8_GOSAR|nr:hypothetical protein PVK06_005167 [Gossypium arboreum]
MFDVHNSDHENPSIIDGHDKIDGEIQPEFVTEDHGDELNTVELVSDSIDIAVELTVKVEMENELTTNMELKLILKESVEESIHFLAIAEKVLIKEVKEVDSFLFQNDNKDQVNKASSYMDGRKRQ